MFEVYPFLFVVDFNQLKNAMKEGSVKTFITKCFIQGEARVGKSSTRSLLVSEKYIDKSSTGCIEPPKVALYQYGYVDSWKHIDEEEMRHQVKQAIQDILSPYYELGIEEYLDDLLSSSTSDLDYVSSPSTSDLDDVPSPSTSDLDNVPSPSTSDLDNVPSPSTSDLDDVSSPSTSDLDDVPSPSTSDLDDMSSPSTSDLSLPRPGIQIDPRVKSFDSRMMIRISGHEKTESSLTEHKCWLYFIDSGGQLEFQKLLPAFMPCASVLIIVVSLAKNLSDPSCTTMNINGEEIESHSEYSLPVEEVLKKVASSVVSSTRHFASFIDKDADLQKYIKPPSSALLNIIPVATHRDVYEETIGKGAALENGYKKVQKIREIFECHKSTCSFVTRDNEITLYEIDGRKAATADTGAVMNPEIEEISRALSDNAYEVEVPLRWYCLNISLQDVAKEGCGVLSLSTCIELGKRLCEDMEESEVVSALNFLHFLNKLLYYPNSKACSDLVFVQMDSLIDITKELTQLVYKKHSDISKLDFSTECLVTRGYLSVDTLQKQSQNCAKISKHFAGFETKLLKLFQELLIAAPLLDKGQYFMPALLPIKDVSKVKPFPNTPLLYYFKDAVPMGLFCAFIAQLLSTKDSKLQWYIVEANWSHFSNYFTLKCHNLKDNFVLIEQLNCIEVHCDGTNPSSLALARDDIKKAIMVAITSHSLGENVIPQEAFYCPCGNEQKHILLITNSITGEHLFTCTKDPTKHIDDDKSWINWLNGKYKIYFAVTFIFQIIVTKHDDEQFTDSDTFTAFDDELSKI